MLQRTISSSICRRIGVQLFALCAMMSLSGAQSSLQSSDAYIRHQGNEWILGTSRVEKRIRLADGQLTMSSLRNKVSGKEYQDGTTAPAEFQFLANQQNVTASPWQWTLGAEHISKGKQGEMQLDLELKSSTLGVTKHYVIYPGTGVIREWLDLQNSSGNPVRISHLDFMHSRVLGSMASELDFYYLTGAGDYIGSQLLKSQPMSPRFQRTLDSTEGAQQGGYSWYLPLIFLHNRTANEGIAIGWDYLGHWRYEIGRQNGLPFDMSLEVAGFDKNLAPQEQIETPKAFTAAFSGGIDELGNQMLDWQYAYMWEFTNPDYFAKTRWAVDWPNPWWGDGGTPSVDNWGRRLALDLRYVDLMRESGSDILWDDAGWYDKWGTWNAPDWKLTNDFVRKHDMRWVLWYPTFLGTAESAVGQMHPDWIMGDGFMEQSIPGTVDWQKKLLDNAVKDWGDFQWRYDIAPAVSANDTDYLKSDQNFRKLLESFKVEHPKSGIDACYNGGRWLSYDIARLAESGEYTDGGTGPYSGYYTSLMLSPDKLHNVVDFDHVHFNAASDSIYLSLNPAWYRDPGDGSDVEAIRREWEIYHYLTAQGAVGRWSHVFRPKVDHDDPVWYFQRMNQDASKGIILTKHAKDGTIYYITSRLSQKTPGLTDKYLGDAGGMTSVTTTSAAAVDTGLYQDIVDAGVRFYGVSGQMFGPVNVKYQSESGDQSLVTGIVRKGAARPVTDHFFGMALQVREPLTISQIGQFDPGGNRGIYTLSVVRADDNKVVATAELDMSKAHPDAIGFKYVQLAQPIRLENTDKPVKVYPHGLAADATYDVRGSVSGIHLSETGAKLMSDGITFDKVPAGELIFLNLPKYPGSATDRVPPSVPSNVTKKLGANLGTEGIEISWSASKDDNWLSYYEVRKNGKLVGKAAIGTFFFDHSSTARHDIDKNYEIVAVDGDGNRSPAAIAQKVAGGPQIYEALGGFSATQSFDQWEYEEAIEDGSFRPLTWDKGGYEGLWTGSGLGKIGRIWMQPSAHYDLSRTFTAPAAGAISAAGGIRKDPSAENQASCFVRIMLNDRQVWPKDGWAEVKPKYDTPTNYEFKDLQISAGDKLRFELKRSGENRPDPIMWNPKIVMQDGEAGMASAQ